MITRSKSGGKELGRRPPKEEEEEGPCHERHFIYGSGRGINGKDMSDTDVERRQFLLLLLLLLLLQRPMYSVSTGGSAPSHRAVRNCSHIFVSLFFHMPLHPTPPICLSDAVTQIPSRFRSSDRSFDFGSREVKLVICQGGNREKGGGGRNHELLTKPKKRVFIPPVHLCLSSPTPPLSTEVDHYLP